MTSENVSFFVRSQICLPLFGERALRVHIKGLEIMNDDPAEVDVLYAKVSAFALRVVTRYGDYKGNKFSPGHGRGQRLGSRAVRPSGGEVCRVRCNSGQEIRLGQATRYLDEHPLQVS